VQHLRFQSHRSAIVEPSAVFDWQDQWGRQDRGFDDARQPPLVDVHEIGGAFRHWDDGRYRIFLPTKGAFAYRASDGCRVVADAAHLFITAPGEMFEIEPLGQIDQFRGLLLIPMEEQLTLDGGLRPRFTNPQAGVRAANMPLDALLLANRIHVLSSFGERNASIEAAVELASMALSARLLPRISKSSPIVDRLKVQLNETFHQRSSLTELAAQVGKSPSLLTQMFSRSQDISFYQYQLKIRLSAALAALFGRHNITEVAYDVGFSSHSHFSVQFRRAFGMSPSKCRLYLASL
jgi:AraC-like DNA-binding protein